MLILDTDHMTLLEREKRQDKPLLSERLSRSGESRITTTIITFEEQMRGWLAYVARCRSLSQQIDGYKQLGSFLENYCAVQVLEFDEKAALQFRVLLKSRIRVGTMDLKIAAIALSHDTTLLSRNLADFRKVPGLKVEDWSV